jgi:hypothetical protein
MCVTTPVITSAIGGQPFIEDLPVGIVGVDDARSMRCEMSLEQTRLGLPVILEVTVKVEVLRRQVGEGRRLEEQAVDPVEHETV